MKFHEMTLDNGLQVIAELNGSVHSVALGFFVRTGARDESPDVSGVSHFLEHMAFKGDDRYSADDVNRIFDELGANYNASTSEEITLFYAAVLPEYLPRTFELLATLMRPSLRQDDFDTEKEVIIEEIGMYEDAPSFTAYEKGMQLHFRGHPLGQSILGTAASIRELTCEQMREYHARRYHAGNLVLAVAGNTSWDEVVSLAKQYCDQWSAGTPERCIDEARSPGGIEIITREASLQEHLMLFAPAPPAGDDLRYAAELLSVVVGDDSGSRMYWDIVDPGFAEAAELGYNEYDGSGTWMTYLSCQPDDVEENRERIRSIFAAINRDGITQEELQQARNKVASRIVLRSERPMGRLSSLGGNWVYRGEYRSVGDDLGTLDTISTSDISRLLEKYPLQETSTIALGPLKTL